MLIVVSGKKRSGKDTFNEIVKEHIASRYPYIQHARFAFADKVKQYAKEYFHVDSSLDGEDKEKIRYTLQGIGQMMREEVSKDFWINEIDRQYEWLRYREPFFVAVVTDARYQNEIEWAIRKRAKVVRVIRPGFDSSDSHASETELDGLSFQNVIYNSGNLEDYREEVIEWITPFLNIDI